MFITLEGIDGCGKTTQARAINAYLKTCAICEDVLWTRQPGDWSDGKTLRELLLHGDLHHPMTELLLFLVDRCENVRTRINPALEKKKFVLCERYCDSTLAYQAWGRGLSMERIEALFDWCEYPVPDLTFWFDLPVDQAWDRLTKRGQARDRIENGSLPFLERVREGYRSLAQRSKKRIVRIDATRSEDEVFKAVRRILDLRMAEWTDGR